MHPNPYNQNIALRLFSMKRIILCYHGIGEDQLNCNVSWKLFQEQIGAIFELHYHINSVQKLIANHHNSNSLAITFDDGLESSLYAIQWLLEKNIPVLWSILGNPDSTAHQNLIGRPVNLKTIASLLATYPKLEIASHSLTHRNLTKMPLKEAAHEISESRNRLQNELQVSVKYFVYPFGHFNKEISSLVEAASYEAALTTIALPARSSGNKYNLPRLCINEQLYPGKRLRQLLTPGGGTYLSLAHCYRKTLSNLNMHHTC
jgi:peptidoglycan/xylan/chitin deacetylase (PgdA/CDA1 family)